MTANGKRRMAKRTDKMYALPLVILRSEATKNLVGLKVSEQKDSSLTLRMTKTIPQSATLTAPFAQGSLRICQSLWGVPFVQISLSELSITSKCTKKHTIFLVTDVCKCVILNLVMSSVKADGAVASPPFVI